MAERRLTDALVMQYRDFLISEEKAQGTIEKYLRDVRAFVAFLPENRVVEKEGLVCYKQQLAARYKAASVNSMLVALNQLWGFLGWNECRIRLLKVQRSCFRPQEKELGREEYVRLVRAAQAKQNDRLSLLIQAICSTGIRVSEHRFITAESLRSGRVMILNKGKARTIFLPDPLRRVLVQYCRQQGIVSGPVFVTRNGRPMDRCNIWAEMKALCARAGVEAQKVFPHNLRHLFAVTYYRMEKDVVRLADVLGHTSVDTTRIYTADSGADCIRTLSRLGLVIPDLCGKKKITT